VQCRCSITYERTYYASAAACWWHVSVADALAAGPASIVSSLALIEASNDDDDDGGRRISCGGGGCSHRAKRGLGPPTGGYQTNTAERIPPAGPSSPNLAHSSRPASK
jgi:hypothetical protein